MFVAGSAIFNTDDYAETIRTMRSELAKVRQHHRSNDPCDSSTVRTIDPPCFYRGRRCLCRARTRSRWREVCTDLGGYASAVSRRIFSGIAVGPTERAGMASARDAHVRTPAFGAPPPP